MSVRESSFRGEIVRAAKLLGMDVWPFSRCGKYAPDLLLVPQGARPFWVETKGYKTGHRMSPGQEDFQTRYRNRGQIVLKLDPSVTAWREILTSLSCEEQPTPREQQLVAWAMGV